MSTFEDASNNNALAEKYQFINTIIQNEIDHTQGNLSTDANRIFADMLTRTLEEASDLGILLTPEILETFLPITANVSANSPLGKLGETYAQEFFDNKWSEEHPYEHARICKLVLLDDDTPNPIAAPLAEMLLQIYGDRMERAVETWSLLLRESDDAFMDTLDDNISATGIMIGHFKVNEEVGQSLKRTLVALQTKFEEIKVDLGYSPKRPLLTDGTDPKKLES